MPRFQDIPQFTKSATYSVNVQWDYLEETLNHYASASRVGLGGLDLEPDFQRAHVWTEAQQTAFVEFCLRGGKSGRNLYFNAVGWQRGWEGAVTIVDGKQRLEAVRRFLRNELRAFGYFKNEYTDRLRITGPDFIFHINDLPDRASVLLWYLEMNSGGTPHTESEIRRVVLLLEEERNKTKGNQ